MRVVLQYTPFLVSVSSRVCDLRSYAPLLRYGFSCSVEFMIVIMWCSRFWRSSHEQRYVQSVVSRMDHFEE